MKLLTEYLNARVPVLSLLLSITVAYLILPIVNGFPMVAVSLFFIGLSSLIYLIKKGKTWTDSILYVGILSLSFFTILRANEFLQFFDVLIMIFFTAVLVRPIIHVQGVVHLLFSPLTVFLNTLFSHNIFKYKITLPNAIKNKNYVKKYSLTFILTAVILLITVPVLASANPLFNKLLQQTLSTLNVEWLWKYLVTDSLAIYILRGAVLVFLGFMVPRALSVTVNGMKDFDRLPALPINYLFPKVALAAILIVFFITQLQLYFASPELLQSLGYTNSKLTNEVFVQVTLVAFIVLLLAYLDKDRKKWNTQITYFLLLEAFFLIGIAFKSVYDYSSLYGFTEKRLWGYASMTWLTGALAAFTYHVIKLTSFQSFIKQILAFSVVVIFMTNFLNFDHLIYHAAKPSTQAGIDYTYISGRSADAHYYAEVLPKLMKQIEASNTPDQLKIQPAQRIIMSIDKLRTKYGQKITINSFNIAEYQEYQATKHLDIRAYEKVIFEKIQQGMIITPSATPTPTR